MNRLTILVNNTAVWVLYPDSVRREYMVDFIKNYYIIHPDKFRPYETLEFSMIDIIGRKEYNQSTIGIEPMRERDHKVYRRVPKLSKTDQHGTLDGYIDGCRCKECMYAHHME